MRDTWFERQIMDIWLIITKLITWINIFQKGCLGVGYYSVGAFVSVLADILDRGNIARSGKEQEVYSTYIGYIPLTKALHQLAFNHASALDTQKQLCNCVSSWRLELVWYTLLHPLWLYHNWVCSLYCLLLSSHPWS